MGKRSTFALLAVLAPVASCGCDSKERGSSPMEAIASANPALIAASTPAPSAAPASEKPIVRRPSADEPLMVTPERRARIEREYPEARGFLTGEELEQKLFALELPRGNDEKALAQLDRLAKGKWILVTGNVANPTADGFELPVRYTPRDPADPVGLTSQWLSVRFSNVRGYSADDYRPGEKLAVLAKYDGRKESREGVDLILSGTWYDSNR